MEPEENLDNKSLNNEDKKELKIFTIGDPHFKVDNILETDVMVRNILTFVDHLNPDIIVVLGDTLDRFHSIHVGPLTRAINFLKELSIRKPLYVLIGNHDRKNNSDFLSDVHPFTALTQWPKCKVVDKCILDYVNGHKLLFVPYVYPGRFEEALLTLGNIEDVLFDVTTIFAHQEFLGCKMGVIFSEAGDPWVYDTTVISGHIHEAQTLGNIIYTGNPDETDSVVLFTFNADKTYEQERLKLNIPKIITINIKATDVLTLDMGKFKNAHVKLILTGTTEEIKTATKTSQLKEIIKMGIKVKYNPSVNNKAASWGNDTEFKKENSMSFLQHLHQDISQDKYQEEWFKTIFGEI